MEKKSGDNVVTFLKIETHQKLIHWAKQSGVSPDAFLNILLNDEIERQRLLGISAEIAQEESQQTVPSQKIAKICQKHLSVLDYESESSAMRKAVENLYNDLLQYNLLSVNSREGQIVESERLKTSRVAYYWYAGILSKRISMWFGTHDVYLFHDLIYPMSEVVFVGMPTNVEVCYQVFTHLYKLFKKAKTAYKSDAGNWGSKSEMEEEANRHMYKFAQELDHTQALIENDNYNKHVYDYARAKFAWAMRD